MIVLLDVDSKAAIVYTDNGKRTIPFHQIDDMIDIVGRGNITYVTQGVETTAHDIVSTVKTSFGGWVESGVSKAEWDGLGLDQETYFIHSTKPGPLYVEDIGFSFNGKDDCRPLTDKMRKLIQKSALLKELIKNGHVEIINSSQMRKVVQEAQNKRKKWEQKRKQDEESRRKNNPGGSSDDDDDGGVNNGDIIEIDMTNELKGS